MRVLSKATGERLELAFLMGAAGPVHVTTFLPDRQPAEGVLVIAQAFAEEANKSRHMLAQLGRALQAVGWGTVLLDPYGTGDSAGDFSEADWALWVKDLRAVTQWAGERFQQEPALLGHRHGALQVAELLSETPVTNRVVLWQPVVDGKQAVTQFLRLRVAGGLGREDRETVTQLRAQLSDGAPVEVAGYRLPRPLVEGLDAATLRAPASAGGVAHCFAVAPQPRESMPPAIDRAIEPWEAAGWAVFRHNVQGDAFWGTQELASVPTLVVETCRVIRGES